MTNLTNKNSYALNYLNQHLLDCETGIDEIFVNVRSFNDSVEVVDVLGAVEDNGQIYIGLEVVTSDFPFGHIIHVSFMNVWGYVYKDEMVEIQDVLSSLISEQLKNDLGLKDNILDDVKQWLKDSMEQYDNKEDLLREIVTYGVENVAPNHLIYNDDIHLYYKEHKKEINNIIKEITGYNIDDAIEDREAFEIVINNIGGIDSELEFENSHELENSELRWFVWLAFEHVAHEYLTALESK